MKNSRSFFFMERRFVFGISATFCRWIGLRMTEWKKPVTTDFNQEVGLYLKKEICHRALRFD